MNLRGLGVVLVAGGVAIAIFVAVLALSGGCIAELPDETGWVEVVTTQDAAMHSYNAP